ncbi:chromophore lyase CpcT/CpeT [Halocola ammonii]
MKFRSFCALLAVILLASCSNRTSTSVSTGGDFEKLKQWMTGSFASSEQHEQDESFFDITLHMYPIWPRFSNDSIFYLYVEQAVTFKQDEPYRQRVYKVFKTDENQFKSEIFLIPNNENYIGAFRSSDPLEGLKPQELEKKDGCAVLLSFSDKAFRGSTDEKSCPSELQGASYATSEVVIKKNEIYSWDRGFDSDGSQVWGAEKGGYVFKRIKN